MPDTAEADSSTVEPRGTKRRIDGSTLDNGKSGAARIQPLAQDVVNKIAAGEIIVAPVHALKELLENAIDAGSSQLEIIVKDGGLKLLQITDNGNGIHKDDLPLLCERFTTSKLTAFEDLTSIGTYGFRGEALASISHIAHLSVTTRQSDSTCAWKAQYSDGHLVPIKPGQNAEPKPTAGRQGTQITVEDLFYNIPTRRRAFRSASEEYSKILDLISRYAIHCENVSFSCKKYGESVMGVSVPISATPIDRIRQIHGSSVANEVIEFNVQNDRYGFKAKGWISNANYNVKRTSFILFINHRAVESPAIKKGVEQTYSTFLPKGGHPFIYLSIDIEPHRVDVNVHPTKREVNFLHQEEIVETICDEIRATLGTVDTSRTFMTQTLLPNVQLQLPKTQTFATPASKFAQTTRSNSFQLSNNITNRVTPRPYDNDLVRTDARERKITSMFKSNVVPELEQDEDEMEYEYTDKEVKVCRLKSITQLRTEVRDCMHNELTDIFASHTYIGLVDPSRRITAIQGGVKLYLVDYAMVCNEYFYQLGLTDFGNFGSIKFKDPLDLTELLERGAVEERQRLSSKQRDVDWDEVVTMIRSKLIERRDMLSECFSIGITEDGQLHGMPLLMKGYTPAWTKLPNFLLRLGPYVNWEDEKPCFHSLLRELASFYVPESVPASRSVEEGEDYEPFIAKRRQAIQKALEDVIFPAFKARLVATKGLLKGVVEVANLKGLYRVFERC